MFIKENLKRTYEYIHNTESNERKGHHVYVAKRMVNDLYRENLDLEKIDNDILERLKYLDLDK